MKQLASNYSISGSAVTLTGVNVPLSQILLVSDATTGNVLYSMAGPAASSYTQATNSVITLSSAPGASDKLTIYYDDGAATPTAKGAATIANSMPVNIASDQIVALGQTTMANSQPVVLASDQSTVPVSLASVPSHAVTNAGTFAVQNTAAVVGGNTTAVKVDGSAVTQPVSGTVTANVIFPTTQNVAIISGSISNTSFGVSSLPANLGTTTLAPAYTQVTNFPATQTVAGSVSVSNLPSSQPVTNAGTFAVQNTSAIVGGNAVAVKVDGSAVTQPVSGTVTANVTFPATQPISASSLPLPSGAAQDGTDATGVTAPTGGVGIRGWLSGIYSKLSSALAVTQSGTWSIGRTWNLASGSDSITATISGTPSVNAAVTNAGTFAVQNTAAVVGGNVTAVKVDGSAVTQPVSGTVTANVTFPTTQNVSLAGGSISNTSFGSKLQDGSGTALTSSLISGHQALDVNIVAGTAGGGGASAAYNATLPTYTSGASTTLQTDANGRLITTVSSGAVSLSAGTQVSLSGGTVSGTVNQGATGATPTSFTSTTSATLQASNANRKKLCIFNQGAGTLYVLLGSGTASTSSYTAKVLSGGYFEELTYTGQVNAIFATAGTALVTEITT